MARHIKYIESVRPTGCYAEHPLLSPASSPMNTSKLLLPLFAVALFALPCTSAQVFTNSTLITIPEPPLSSGPATPYPATLFVSGTTGTITNLTVSLLGLSHTFPDDLDVLLVGPTGAKSLLMSDAGGEFDLSNVTLTFSTGATPLPDNAIIITGTYSPTDYVTGDIFPAPAPAGPYTASFADFIGTSANGTWSLYIVDDAGGDTGQIAGGFSLNITTSGGGTGTGVPDEGSTFVLAGLSLIGLEAARRRTLRN